LIEKEYPDLGVTDQEHDEMREMYDLEEGL